PSPRAPRAGSGGSPSAASGPGVVSGRTTARPGRAVARRLCLQVQNDRPRRTTGPTGRTGVANGKSRGKGGRSGPRNRKHGPAGAVRPSFVAARRRVTVKNGRRAKSPPRPGLGRDNAGIASYPRPGADDTGCDRGAGQTGAAVTTHDVQDRKAEF